MSYETQKNDHNLWKSATFEQVITAKGSKLQIWINSFPFQIIRQINTHLQEEVKRRAGNDYDRLARMSIIEEGEKKASANPSVLYFVNKIDCLFSACVSLNHISRL